MLSLTAARSGIGSLAVRLVSAHSRVFPAILKLQNMPLTFNVAMIKYLFFGANPSGNYLN